MPSDQAGFSAGFFEFVRRVLWNKVVATIAGALVGGFTGFIWEDLDAYVRWLAFPGNLGGNYVIVSSTIEDDPPYSEKPIVNEVVLKHGGNRVFGNIKVQGVPYWKFGGYLRNRYMALAYGGLKEDGLGAGTYSFQKDRPDIFWGHAVVVECIGLSNMYVRCTAVMYRKGSEKSADKYVDFLKSGCDRILPEEASQTCKGKKLGTISRRD